MVNHPKMLVHFYQKPTPTARNLGKPSWRKQSANWAVKEQKELARFVGRFGRRVGKVFPAQGKAWIRAQKARESGTSMELAGVWPPPQAWGGWQCLRTAPPPIPLLVGLLSNGRSGRGSFAGSFMKTVLTDTIVLPVYYLQQKIFLLRNGEL